MTITITKAKFAAALVVVALLVPATAFATHVFDDVEDDRFYAEPVEWAAANAITTGKTPDLFDPEGAVTRGESVTFLQRYDENIVQPALDAVDPLTPIAVAHADLAGGGTFTINGTDTVSATWNGVDTAIVSVDGVALSAATHAVLVTPVRVNQSDPTADRTAQTFFDGTNVHVSIWDENAAMSVGSDFHITIWEIPG